MKLRSALLAATVIAAPVAAMAQPVTGPYVSLGVGANFMQQESLSTNTFRLPSGRVIGGLHGHADFKPGIIGLASVGYGLGNGLRIELEGDFRQNQLNKVSGFSAVSGNEQKYGAMVNVLYDFNPMGFGFLPTFSPYVGVGIGYQHVMWKGVYGSNFVPGFGPVGDKVNTGEDTLAYQAILGAALDLNAMAPGLALTLEYRFMGIAGDQTFKSQLLFPGGATRANIKMSDDYNHAVLIGLRYNFGQTPPPPPPAPAPVAAPAPAPARTYLVFFDWDRADLTARARQIISEAAQASTRVQYTRILVNGYTDRSGLPSYNVKLSWRRAENVAAELVRDGVPRQAIDIHGYGETHPLVPTAPGVREPQNRRVEIILR